MDLSVSNNVDSATLDTYLKGKGVMDGHGSEFKKAADDIYLTLVQDSVIAGAKGADKAVDSGKQAG